MAKDNVVAAHDAALAWFKRKARAAADVAEADVLAQIASQLEVDDAGRIIRTAENRRLLNGVGPMLERALRRAGYTAALVAFLRGFDQQVPLFMQSLTDNGMPPVRFGLRDVDVFAEQQSQMKQVLEQPQSNLVSRLKRTVALLGSGVALKALISAVKKAFDNLKAQAQEASITTLSTFYRTVAARGFDILSARFVAKEPLFVYVGPLDEKNRPKCHEWKLEDQQWTRGEIAQLTNGYEKYGFGDVMIHGGGPGCRHFWRAIAWASKQPSGLTPLT